MEGVVLSAEGKDIIQFTDINLKGSYTNVAREMDFSIASSSTDPILPVIDLPCGAEVSLKVGGVEAFYGHIYEKSTAINSDTDSYTAYDSLYVMLHDESQVTFNFKGVSPSDATRQICKAVGLDYGGCDDPGSPIDRIFQEVNAYEAMMTMWTIQSKKDGKKYMPIIRDRKVYIVEKGKEVMKHILDPSTSIINATYKESSKDLYASKTIYDKNNKPIGKLGQVVDRSADISILGDLNCITGMGVVINEPYTGLYGLFYIDSDTHSFNGGAYETQLSLAFENMMDEKDANSEKKKTKVDKGGLAGSTVQEQVWSFFLSKGYTKEAIAGIIGNMGQESNFNPNTKGDGGTSYGLCQWHKDRWDSMKKWCKKNGLDYKTVKGQLNFLHYELQSSYNGKTYMNITDVDQATDWFTSHYEKPDERLANRKGRKETARRYYNDLKDWEPPKVQNTSKKGEVPPSSIADGAITSGKSVIGSRYLWSGNNPSTGIDCSGFVQWSYNQAGANIPGRLTTGDLARRPAYYGFKKIPWDEKQPGDVVYVDGHVGLYYGDGKTLESGGTSSQVLGYSGVAITNNLGYFKTAYRYVGW